MYKLVNELNESELNELRNALYGQLLDEGIVEFETMENVDNNMLFEHYEGICFVDDDFFCNQ